MGQGVPDGKSVMRVLRFSCSVPIAGFSRNNNTFQTGLNLLSIKLSALQACLRIAGRVGSPDVLRPAGPLQIRGRSGRMRRDR